MRYLDVATLQFNEDKCIKCKRCIEVCPHHVFEMTDRLQVVNKSACMECGACQMNCPTSALSVNAGTGCASAVLYTYFKKNKFLKRFFKSCC